MIGILVITHGPFGAEILRTAQDMVGRQSDIAAISLSPESPSMLVCDTLKRLSAESKADAWLILVDMLGGTPCNQALLHGSITTCEVVTGVNLYMLLSAFKNRQGMDLASLAARVVEDAKKSIVLPKALLTQKKTS